MVPDAGGGHAGSMGPVPPPVPVHVPVVGSKVVFAPQVMCEMHWPPTISAPRSALHGIASANASAGTHCSTPPFIWSNFVPGPHTALLQPARFHAAAASTSTTNERFMTLL